jgi:hypothetical protein
VLPDAFVSISFEMILWKKCIGKCKYPLSFTSTLFENSKDSLQLHLADILAGAAAERARS